MQTIEEITTRADRVGWKSIDLARAAGVAPSTLYRMKRGDTRNPWATTLARLAQALTQREADLREHLRELQRKSA